MRIAAWLVAYALLLFGGMDLLFLILAGFFWGLATWTVAAAADVLRAVAQAAVAVLMTSPDRLVDHALSVALPVTAVGLAAYARLVLWPLTVEHAVTEPSRATEVIDLPERRRTQDHTAAVA